MQRFESSEEATRDYLLNDLGEAELAESISCCKHYYLNPRHLNEIDTTFRRQIEEDGQFELVETCKDGTSFFKALALILYGSMKYYIMVNCQILDYLEANKERFRKSVSRNFEEFLAVKRTRRPDPCYVQYKAAAELYGRPIIVYQYNEGNSFLVNQPALKQIIVDYEPEGGEKILIPIMREDLISHSKEPIHMAQHMTMYFSALLPKHWCFEAEEPQLLQFLEESERGP